MRLFINIGYSLSILAGLWMLFLLIDLIILVMYRQYFGQSNASNKAEEYSVKAHFKET